MRTAPVFFQVNGGTSTTSISMFKTKPQPPDGVIPNAGSSQTEERRNVFICYAPQDRQFVEDLSGALKKRRRLADVEWETLSANENAFERISRRVLATDTFLFVASPESVASPLCKSLLDHALDNNKNVVPVLRRETKMPVRLRNLDVIDYRPGATVADAFSTVVQAVTTDLNVDVFICYSRRDYSFVQRLYESFDGIGRTCWMDLTSIPFTGKWKDEVLAGIDVADNFLFVMSPNSVHSQECFAELSHAVARNKRIVPILCREVEDRDVPAALAEIQRIPFVPPVSYDHAFDGLVKALEQDLEYVNAHKNLLVQTERWHKNPDQSRLLVGNELAHAEELIRQGATKFPKPSARQANFVIASREGASKSQRRRVVGLSVALVVSLAATIFAVFQMRVAQAAQKEAEAQTAIAKQQRTIAEEQTNIASSQQQEANRQREVAVGKQEEAEDQREIANEQRTEAERQRNIANDQTILANKREDDAIRQLANNYLGNGLNAVGSEDWLSASHYFAKAAQISRDKEVIARVSRDVARMNQHVSLEYFKVVGRPIASLEANAGWDRLLITTEESVELRDAMNGEIRKTLVSEAEFPKAIFSNDGRQIVAWYRKADNKSFAFLAEATTGEITFRLSQAQMSSVLGAKFSKDNSLVLTWGMGGAQLWRTSDGSLAAPFMKHELSWCDPPEPSQTHKDACSRKEPNGERSIRPVVKAVFSPNEEYILTVTNDGDARLWLTKAGSQVGPGITPTTGASDALFSHDGKLALLLNDGSRGTIATLWKIPEGSQVGDPIKHPGGRFGVGFSHDSTLLLTWAGDSMARLWKTKDASLAAPPLRHYGIDGPTFSRDDAQLLTRSDGAYVWNTKSLLELGPAQLTPNEINAELLRGRLRSGFAIAGASLTQDETQILTWGHSGTLLWSNENYDRDTRLNSENVTGAQLSHNSTYLLTTSDNDVLRLWWPSGAGPASPQMLHPSQGNRIRTLVNNNDNRYILSWSQDGAVRLWRTDLTKPQPAVMSQEEGIEGATLVRNDREVMTWDQSGNIQFWNATTGKPTSIERPTTATPDEIIQGTDLNKTKSLLLTWNHSVMRLWNMKDGSPARQAITLELPIEGARLSPEGDFVMAWSHNGKIGLWNTADATNEPRKVLQFSNALSGALVSPNGRFVMGWNAQSLQLWSKDGSLVGKEMKHGRPVEGRTPSIESWLEAVFSPNSELVASWGVDGTARIWRTSDGLEVGKISSDYAMSGATFSPNSHFLLAWAMDGKGHLRRVGESKDRAVLNHGSAHFITFGTFNKKSDRVVTFGTDFTARLWNCEDGTALAPPMYHLGQGKAADPGNISDFSFKFKGGFSGDGRFLLTVAGRDNVVRLWNSDGSPADQFHGSTELYLEDAVFSSDERSVLLWAGKGAQVWDISVEEKVSPAHLPLYLEVLTGTSISDVGTVTQLSVEDWLERKRRFNALPPESKP